MTPEQEIIVQTPFAQGRGAHTVAGTWTVAYGVVAETALRQWKTICALDDILPGSGVVTLIGQEQVAIFRVNQGDEMYAISNYDPFSKANVLSRGLVGDRIGTPKVASPIYKQNFDLQTGQCLDDDHVRLSVWKVQVVDGAVQIAVS